MRGLTERRAAVVVLADRDLPLQARGVPLDRMFSPAMLKGGYRKKYLDAICPA